jgi:exopolyphosphatase/guanosine-5'-triphosphate,3'-diphosphate pyrophosphatase
MICGIVDLGSNTIRLSIYKYENGRTELMLSKKSVAGLLGYVTNGVLNAKGIAKACSVLNNFKDILTHFHIENAFIFATASLRNISNAEEVLKAIKAFTGYDVDVLSGEDEAKLDFYGACARQHSCQGSLSIRGAAPSWSAFITTTTWTPSVCLSVRSTVFEARAGDCAGRLGLKNIRQDVLGSWPAGAERRKNYGYLWRRRHGPRRAEDKQRVFDVPTDNMVIDTENLSQILSVYRKNSRKV